MDIRKILSGKIENFDELIEAINLFEYYEDKDILTESIINSWERLNKPCVIINESHIFYQFAPNEMKQTKLTPMNEAIFFNEEDLVFNFQNWKKEKNKNILYVTGLSGSGKSTISREYAKKYNAVAYTMDVVHEGRLDENEFLKKYADNNKDYLKMVETNWRTVNSITYFHEHFKFMEFMISELHKMKNKLFIIEGIHIYEMYQLGILPHDYFDDKPSIIKGTSAFTSFIRRILRAQGGVFKISELLHQAKIGWGFKYYIEDEKKLSGMRSALNESITFNKYNINDEPIYYMRDTQSFAYTDLDKDTIIDISNNTSGNFNRNFDKSVFELSLSQSDEPNITITQYDKNFYYVTNKDIKKDEKLTVDFSIKPTKSNNKLFNINPKNPVFVLLTYTGSAMTKLIHMATHKDYSHSSISFDSSLTGMFSFGRKKNNLLGFTKESMSEGFFKENNEQVTYALYVTYATDMELMMMKNKLLQIYSKNKQSELKYNYAGLFRYLLNKPKEYKDALFCSEFVSVVLNDGVKVFGVPGRVAPHDFQDNMYFHFVENGILKDYDEKRIDTKVKDIYNSNYIKIIRDRLNIFNTQIVERNGNKVLSESAFLNDSVPNPLPSNEYITWDELFNYYIESITDDRLFGVLKLLITRKHLQTENEIVKLRNMILNEYTGINKKTGLEILDLMEYLITDIDWAFQPALTLAQTDKSFCDKYSNIYSFGDIRIYSDFTPAPLRDEYYMQNTNGGLYYTLSNEIVENPDFELRLSEIDEFYDQSKNLLYSDEKIMDKNHIMFALNLSIWRFTKYNKTNVIYDRIMINEWNERVKRYYNKLKSLSKDDDGYFKYCQMLADIMWLPHDNPYCEKIRNSNLNSFINRLYINPTTLFTVNNKFMLRDMGNMLSENANTQPKDLSNWQKSLLNNNSCDLSFIYECVLSEEDIDVNALFLMNSIIENAYIYGHEIKDREKNIKLRQRIISTLCEQSDDSFMDNFTSSPYYDKHVQINKNMSHIKALNNYCLNN